VEQCIRDGILVEGLHIDPGLYLSEFQQYRGKRNITLTPAVDLCHNHRLYFEGRGFVRAVQP
jgi:hypothetical protein